MSAFTAVLGKSFEFVTQITGPRSRVPIGKALASSTIKMAPFTKVRLETRFSMAKVV